MRRVTLLVATLGCLGMASADAQAWVTFGPRWSDRTITYRVASPSLGAAASRAASAWNHSGTGVRWRRTRGRADVTVAITPGLRTPGRALLAERGGHLVRARIQIAPNAGRLGRSPAERRFVQTLDLVHEMGHSLGLNHDTRFCATMQPLYVIGAPAHCRLPDEPWRFRCRLLEPDDLTGARRLYGGHIRVRGPEFCDLEAAPAAVQDAVAVVRGPTGTEISWRTPAGESVGGVRILRGPVCPSDPDDPQAQTVAEVRALPGTTQRVVDVAGQPGQCYAVTTLGAFGRPGATMTATASAVLP